MNINPPAQTEMAPSELTPQLDTILASVLLLIAAQFRILGIITVPLWNRISRSRQRLARLLAHLAAGRLPRIRPPDNRPRPDAPRTEPNGAPAMPIPRPLLWLVIKLGYHAAGYGSQLNHLLQTPGVAETLAASPGAVRTLRPICRMLGVDLPTALQLPPRPKKPRAKKPQPAKPAPEPPAHKMHAEPGWSPNLPLAPQSKPRPLPFLPPFVKFRRTGNA